MSLSPKEVKKDIEEANTKEEDWEVVSGMKSLTVETTTGPENAEQKNIDTNMENKEITIKEPEKRANETEGIKSNVGVVKEAEDWYQTIPPTPMNTPEFTPNPPSYPSANRQSENQKGPEITELTPITEEMLDDQNQNNTTRQEDGSGSYDNQGDLQNQSNCIVKKSIDILIFSVSRLAIFVVAFSIIKWLFTKACQKIKSIRATRSESK